MTMQQDARRYIEEHGLSKAARVASVNHEFYSEKTGSYYATNKNQSVSIKHLRKAIAEYSEIESLRRKLYFLVNNFNGVKND